MDREDRAALGEIARAIGTAAGAVLAASAIILLLIGAAISLGVLAGLAFRAFHATCGC